jgi:hypothetical protein
MAGTIEVKVDNEKGLTAMMDGFSYRLVVDDTTAMVVVRDELSDHQQCIYLDRARMNVIKQLLNLTDL